jgi:hypothetical protein
MSLKLWLHEQVAQFAEHVSSSEYETAAEKSTCAEDFTDMLWNVIQAELEQAQRERDELAVALKQVCFDIAATESEGGNPLDIYRSYLVGAAEIGAEQADELLKVRRERDALRDALVRAFNELKEILEFTTVEACVLGESEISSIEFVIEKASQALSALEDKHGK